MITIEKLRSFSKTGQISSDSVLYDDNLEYTILKITLDETNITVSLRVRNVEKSSSYDTVIVEPIQNIETISLRSSRRRKNAWKLDRKLIL